MRLAPLKALACSGLLLFTVGLAACGEESSSRNRPLITISPTTKPPQSLDRDQEIAKKLVGTWQAQFMQDDMLLQAEESFYPSQEFSGTAQAVNSDGQTLFIRYSGTWRIQGGYLHYKIASSSLPEILPVGDLSANKVISISDKDLVYEDEYAEKQVSRRVS